MPFPENHRLETTRKKTKCDVSLCVNDMRGIANHLPDLHQTTQHSCLVWGICKYTYL